MDIKYPVENEYMKCVLKINGFSSPRPWVRSCRRVGLGQGGHDINSSFQNICNLGFENRVCE